MDNMAIDEYVKSIAEKYNVKTEDFFNKSKLCAIADKMKNRRKDNRDAVKNEMKDMKTFAKDVIKIACVTSSIVMTTNLQTFPVGVLGIIITYLINDTERNQKDLCDVRCIIDDGMSELERSYYDASTMDQKKEINSRLSELKKAKSTLEKAISEAEENAKEYEERMKDKHKYTKSDLDRWIKNHDTLRKSDEYPELCLPELWYAGYTDDDMKYIASITEDDSYMYDLEDQAEDNNSINKVIDFFKDKKLGLVMEIDENGIEWDVYCDISNGNIRIYQEDKVPCISPNPMSFSKLLEMSKKECETNPSIVEADGGNKIKRLNESIFSSDYAKYDLDFKVCYNGYSKYVNDVRKYINYVELNSLIRDMKVIKSIPGNKVVVNIIEKDVTTGTSNNWITVITRDRYDKNYSGSYEKYLLSNMILYILFINNPNCDYNVALSIAKWKSGLLDDYKEEGVDALEWKYGEVLDRMSKNHYNDNEVYKMTYPGHIAANDYIKELLKATAPIYEYGRDEDKDWSTAGIGKLVRRIKMNTRKAVHHTNSVNRDIENTTDLLSPTPDMSIPVDIVGDGKAVRHKRKLPDGEEKIISADALATKEKIAADSQVQIPAAGTAVGGGNAPKSESVLQQYQIDENDYIDCGNYMMILSEDSKYNTTIRGLLYKDRLKKDKDLISLYSSIKNDNPQITKTFVNLARYKGLNVYVDMAYYNQSFAKNNKYKGEKAIAIYTELLKRYINNSMYIENGYKRQTIFIPVLDWCPDAGFKPWLFKNSINPISAIYRLIVSDPGALLDIFGDRDVVFCGTNNYFKINFTNTHDNLKLKFLELIKKLIALGQTGQIEEDPMDEPTGDSPKAIAYDIADKLEKSQNISITKMQFTGTNNGAKNPYDTTKPLNVKSKAIATPPSASDVKDLNEPERDKEKEKVSDGKDVSKSVVEKEKEKLANEIIDAANNSTSVDDAMEKLDGDYVKKLIASIADEENPSMNKARSARMTAVHDKFIEKQIRGKSIKDMLDPQKNNTEEPIPETALPIASINPEWKKMQYMNFDKLYDMDADIIRILESMSTWSLPIAIREVSVQDDSTSEDYLDLWTVNCEDSYGKRFSLIFDVPKFVNNNKYLRLRGNDKTIESQITLIPVLKTDDDAAQIVSNYKKIFVRRYNMVAGKSCIVCDRIVRALRKYKGNKITVYEGDNSKVCRKYDLPIQYVDLASVYDKIETPEHIIYFNQDEIRERYKVDDSKGIPFAVYKNSMDSSKWTVIYNTDGNIDHDIYSIIMQGDKEFVDICDTIPRASKYCYTKASILNSAIPLIVILGYHVGLTNVLNRQHINYSFKEKLDKYERTDVNKDWIKFSDGYLVYDNNIETSILLNGLKECPTESYSVANADDKSMYVDFLGEFCERIKADGLDNFYDCMIDPITKEALEHYKLPTDYIGCLLYANDLLADNKFVNHTTITSRRLRREEIVAGYVYQALTDSYGTYAMQNKHMRTGTPMTIKRTAVIDKFMMDPTEKDLSINNMLSDVESTNSVSAKGLVGMNSERSYSLDKRIYDESMLNVLGMSTGFAGNVGITRQATLDMNVSGKRGYIENTVSDSSELNDVKTLTATEAVSPFCTTHNDPFRSAMTFIQKSKHAMRCYDEDPLLVTNGADEALPYMSSDIFAHKAKGKGKVAELVPDQYMIIEYSDGTPNECINLSTTIEKNSDGGFFIPLKLDTDLKVGSTVKEGQIVAYDHLSIGNTLGESGNLAYKAGTLAKVAIPVTDEGYEDSAIISDRLSKAMSCDIIKVRSVTLDKNTNIYDVVPVGSHIEEGDQLMVWQTPYDSEDLEILQRNLAGDSEELSALGRNPVKAECTGTLIGMRLYRCVELNELSPSLRKLFNAYEKPINEKKKVMESKGIPTYNLPPTYKLSPTGKLKHCEDGILIEFCQQYTDVPAIGDKIVWQDANKGVNKGIFPVGKEPYTALRPNEVIDGFITTTSINGRMVCSIGQYGALAKLMVELDRTCKDMLGIKYDDSKA